MLLCMVVNVETVIDVNDLLLIVHVLAHFIKRCRPLDESFLTRSRRMQLTVHRCHARNRGVEDVVLAAGRMWSDVDDGTALNAFRRCLPCTSIHCHMR